MAIDVSLTNLANLSQQSTAVTAINANNDEIETALQDALSRSGDSPNQMSSTLDMDSNRIINLPAPASDSEPARKIDLDSVALGTSISAFGQTLIQAVNQAAAQSILGIVGGSGFQPADADLTSIAAISGTNVIPYRSASNTYGTVTIGDGLNLTTGTLKVLNPTTLTINSATIGTHKLAVAGTAKISGNVGLGTETNPQTNLVVSQATGTGIAPIDPTFVNTMGLFVGPDSQIIPSVITVAAYGTNGDGTQASVSLRAARGTASNFTAIQSGDTIGIYGARGAIGNNTWATVSPGNGSAGFMRIIATENFSATNRGTAVHITTTPNTTASPITALVVNSSGGVSVGTALDPGVNNIAAAKFNGLTLTSTTGTLTIANSKTLSVQKTLTLDGTDGQTMTFPAVSDTLAGVGTANVFTAAQKFKGLIVAVTTVTSGASYTALTTDYFITVNKTSGSATTINLMASPETGRTFLIKDEKGDCGVNNITIAPAAGNIDNAATYVMSTNKMSVGVTYNGTQWLVN